MAKQVFRSSTAGLSDSQPLSALVLAGARQYNSVIQNQHCSSTLF
jgi:hypothetical protein